MTNPIGGFYSGTSGMVLPVPNKLSYPPEFQDKSRLFYYASLLNSLEVNSSFYKVPMAVTVKKWAEAVPEYFRFTFKMWRDITHNKGLAYNPEAVNRFIKVIDQAGTKKGVLLLQFPPGLRYENIRQLARLLNDVREADAGRLWKTAVEFRHPSWYCDETYDLLGELNMALVLHDLPASATPFIEMGTDFMYVRFHGPEGGYRGSYPDSTLAEYANYINEWRTAGKTVYAYFNNTIGNALQNLVTLNSMVNP